MRHSASRSAKSDQNERAALVGLFNSASRQFDPEHSLDELAGLADAAGASVVLRVMQERPKPDPATFLGSGKVAVAGRRLRRARRRRRDLRQRAQPRAAPQPREGARPEGRRSHAAHSRHLRAARPHARRQAPGRARAAEVPAAAAGRLVATALSRLGGGIGTRGPGETKLETDRRRIRHRISILSSEIDTVRRRRTQLRERRHKSAVPTVALVGYTNAGKTTLFNGLTGDDATVSNALFVTLDPLVRKVRLPDRRELLVSDTVGFIERLPHSLVAAFRATLEEVAAADLLLHVIDASNPERERQMAAVRSVLAEVGADRVPLVDVFNKCDRLDPGERARIRALYPGALCVSARDGRRARRADCRDGRTPGARHRARDAGIRSAATGIASGSRISIASAASCATCPPTAGSRSRRSCRSASSTVSRTPWSSRHDADRSIPWPARRARAGRRWLSLGAAACAPKKAVELPPAAPGAPKYPDFVFPAASRAHGGARRSSAGTRSPGNGCRPGTCAPRSGTSTRP